MNRQLAAAAWQNMCQEFSLKISLEVVGIYRRGVKKKSAKLFIRHIFTESVCCCCRGVVVTNCWDKIVNSRRKLT